MVPAAPPVVPSRVEPAVAPGRQTSIDAPLARESPSSGSGPSSLSAEERSTKDEYVRKATLGRIRKIVTEEWGSFSEVPVRGFDLVVASGL
jgi:hypothetical protein